MKKNLLLSLLFVFGLTMIGCGALRSNMNDENNRAEITEQQAKEIALEDAQVTKSDVNKIRIERDRDDGRQVYDIEFYVGAKEYDYEIDLYTGEILSKDLDIENDFGALLDTGESYNAG